MGCSCVRLFIFLRERKIVQDQSKYYFTCFDGTVSNIAKVLSQKTPSKTFLHYQYYVANEMFSIENTLRSGSTTCNKYLKQVKATCHKKANPIETDYPCSLILNPGRNIKRDLFQPFACANNPGMKQFDFMLARFIKGIKRAGLADSA